MHSNIFIHFLFHFSNSSDFKFTLLIFLPRKDDTKAFTLISDIILMNVHIHKCNFKIDFEAQTLFKLAEQTKRKSRKIILLFLLGLFFIVSAFPLPHSSDDYASTSSLNALPSFHSMKWKMWVEWLSTHQVLNEENFFDEIEREREAMKTNWGEIELRFWHLKFILIFWWGKKSIKI